jgi:hypothetical protein
MRKLGVVTLSVAPRLFAGRSRRVSAVSSATNDRDLPSHYRRPAAVSLRSE